LRRFASYVLIAMNTLVTIITPAYNAAPYISDAIESVLRQTWPHWEMIIVDDGSTDHTCAVVSRYTDARIRLLRNTHSGLPAVGRNTGLTHASGEYIAFLDADDLWLPEKLATLLSHLESHPYLGLVFSKYAVWRQGAPRATKIAPNLRGFPNPGLMFHLLCTRPVICNSSVVVKRALLDQYGCLDEDPKLRGTEDYELWLRLSAHVPFGFVTLPLVLYRVSSASLTSNAAGMAEGASLAIEKTLDKHPEMRLSSMSSRLAAQKLLWLGRGQCLDRIPGRGTRALLHSLRLRPLQTKAWKWLLLSLVEPQSLHRLRSLVGKIW
jgi:glycosyltransferase involved in cell wall biosynthesis